MFAHLGRVQDVDLSDFVLNDGTVKVGQGQTYATGAGQRRGSDQLAASSE